MKDQCENATPHRAHSGASASGRRVLRRRMGRRARPGAGRPQRRAAQPDRLDRPGRDARNRPVPWHPARGARRVTAGHRPAGARPAGLDGAAGGELAPGAVLDTAAGPCVRRRVPDPAAERHAGPGRHGDDRPDVPAFALAQWQVLRRGLRGPRGTGSYRAVAVAGLPWYQGNPATRTGLAWRRRLAADELGAFGGACQRHGGRVRGYRRGDEVEVTGAHLALVTRGGVPVRLGAELGVLQPHVGGHTLFAVPASQFEHRVVQRVESGQRDELELVAHLTQLALELLDGAVVQVLAPVERG